MLKQIVLDILDYLHWQVEQDKCTSAELRSVYKTAVENLDIEATSEDIAAYYGQSESNVRHALTRCPIGKPKRRVYYRLGLFQKYLPKTWRRKTAAERNDV